MEISKAQQKEIEKYIPKSEQEAFIKKALDIALKERVNSKTIDDKAIEIYTDGGSRGNPGPAGGGFVIYCDGKLKTKGSIYFGEKTNNQAEYLALREALREAYAKFKDCKIICYLDSKLAVEQMNGNYKVKSDNVRPLFQEVRRIADQFKNFSIHHIPRAENKEADQLANDAMDNRS